MSDDFFTATEINKIRDVTLEEIEELLEKAEKALLELRNTGCNSVDKQLNALRSAFHTIYGSAGIAGLSEISLAAQKAQDIFQSGELLPATLPDALKPALGEITDLTARFRENH